MIEHAKLDIGTIESISSTQIKVEITNNGTRGLFSCIVSLNGNIDGLEVKVPTSGGQGKNIINLLPGESSDIIIDINAFLVPRFDQIYNAAITLTKNTFTFRDDYQGTIEIPISFYVDYPAYSKKMAKSPLVI